MFIYTHLCMYKPCSQTRPQNETHSEHGDTAVAKSGGIQSVGDLVESDDDATEFASTVRVWERVCV